MILYYITIGLLVCYTILIIVYWMGWLSIPHFIAPSISSNHRITYSVLIPARNESFVISKCLEDLMKQDFDSNLFEVLVINDYSTDETSAMVLNTIETSGFARIRLLHMADDMKQRRTKKAAITFGVENAQGDYIILTDADCERGTNWLETIDSFVRTQYPKLIYAPVAFKANNVFEKIQAMEFAGLVGIGASAIAMKNPNMCSAANLVFEKKVFHEVDGYTGNDGIASGDDEFLMHRVFKRYPDGVRFLKHRGAIVTTTANASLKQLADQRRRWVSKSTKYENRYITAILVGAYLFNAAVAWFLITDWQKGIWLLLTKTLVEGVFLYSVLDFFKRKRYLLFLPVAEVFHIIYVLVIGIWANAGTYNWKGRNLR